MSTTTTWKSLAVKEFINSCNWQGLLPQVSSKSINQFRESLTSWQSLTTYKFFTLNNWDGQTNLLITEDEIDTFKPAIAFSLTLPINQFWQCFIWSGQLEAPKVQSPTIDTKSIANSEHPPTKTEELTLKDLSQLF
ncbi:MAG: hypothetical protein ACRC2S_22395 [Waterburya sp.]